MSKNGSLRRKALDEKYWKRTWVFHSGAILIYKFCSSLHVFTQGVSHWCCYQPWRSRCNHHSTQWHSAAACAAQRAGRTPDYGRRCDHDRMPRNRRWQKIFTPSELAWIGWLEIIWLIACSHFWLVKLIPSFVCFGSISQTNWGCQKLPNVRPFHCQAQPWEILLRSVLNVLFMAKALRWVGTTGVTKFWDLIWWCYGWFTWIMIRKLKFIYCSIVEWVYHSILSFWFELKRAV